MSLFKVLTEAINYFVDKGYDSQKSLEKWLKLLKKAIESSLPSTQKSKQQVETVLKNTYNRLVTRGGLTIDSNIRKGDITQFSKKLRAELDRRILASANLITYNREEMIAKTLRRFSGWVTSIPIGGMEEVDKVKEKKSIRKAVTRMPYEERRIQIDQTHKLMANIKAVAAEGSDAIAAEWNSHWRQMNYNYRPDHKARDEKIYVLKNGWAYQEGLIKATNGFTTDITAPAEEPFCRCSYRYIFAIQEMPEDMLTEKGKALIELARKRRKELLSK